MNWWETDKYEDETPIPKVLRLTSGPTGIAVVRAWEDGKTTAGWGRDQFMTNYKIGKFHPDKRLAKRQNFAIVMRSVSAICIDIDGKNGGLTNVGKLGMLPPTLAETSKSGNGYHLFYMVPDTWDGDSGFAAFQDRIGIVPGVDIRAVGCVYHYGTQRWNDRTLADLPQFQIDLLHKKQAQAAEQIDRIIELLDMGDDDELLLVHNELRKDLAKPIPAGKRNSTLFAIGTQMKMAQYPDWELMVKARAAALGLDLDESDKLVGNIKKYGC